MRGVSEASAERSPETRVYVCEPETGALLAFAAAARRDRIGLILFSDQVELRLAPAKGDRHAHRVVREI